MAVRSLWGVLLLVPTLWVLGATQKISVDFLRHTFSGKEGEVGVVNVRVDVYIYPDTKENLTIFVTSEDGEAKAGRDFDPVDSTITLTTEDLVGILWTGHQYFPVEISLTEDDYIEPIQTFTLTLKVQSALDVEEGITSATFTITDKRSDTVKISFDQPTYTAYVSQNAPLKLLKTGHIRQNISVDVVFSNGSLIQTILFEPLQDVIEVSFDPGSETATYSLSLALAEPSHNLEGVVVLGAPAEVEVLDFTPEGSRIIKLLEGKIQASVVILQEEHDNLHKEHDNLRSNYSRLQEKYADLQRRVEDLQGLKVEFERKQYYMAKNDESVKVCLKKNMTTAKDLIVTVTAKKNKDSQKRETGGEDAFQEKFTIPAGSVKAECFGFDMTRGDAFAEDIFTLTLTVDDHTVPSTSATVTITESLTVLFEPSEYTVSKGDTAVNVCLKKSVKISEELTVTVTAKESPPPSTKRTPAASQTFTFPADSWAAQPDPCKDIGIPVEKGTFILTLDVKDRPNVESRSATVTITDDDFGTDTPTSASSSPSETSPSAPSSTLNDYNPMVYVWVIVAVVITIIILAMAIAAYVIYRQREKIKECFASPYKKLPTDVHIETVTF